MTDIDQRKSANKPSLFKVTRQERSSGRTPLPLSYIRKLAEDYGDASTLDSLNQLIDGRILPWEQLRQAAQLLSLLDDHDLYEKALRKQDEDLFFPKWKSAKFTGVGTGAGSLNAYRVLDTYDGPVFEKIYMTGSLDLQRSSWFYLSILPNIVSPPYVAPNLWQVSQGQRLALNHQQYLDLSTGLTKSKLIEFSADVTSYFTNLEIGNLLDNAPRDYLNLHTESHYTGGRRCLIALLDKYGLKGSENLPPLEAGITQLPHALAHCDINTPNAFEGKVLLDWDRCGYYPLGFDLAFTLSRSMKFSEVEELEQTILKLMRPRINRKKQELFLQGCLYFSMIFYAHRFRINSSDEFLLALWNRCTGVQEKRSRRWWWPFQKI